MARLRAWLENRFKGEGAIEAGDLVGKLVVVPDREKGGLAGLENRQGNKTEEPGGDDSGRSWTVPRGKARLT